MGVSTHVLDTEAGRPAAGMAVSLEVQDDAGAIDLWSEVAEGATDAEGRCRTLIPDGTTVPAGVYRLRFETAAYYATAGREGLYPYVEIVFTVRDERHYHVPLLLTANGFSTYRGS